MKNRIKSYSTKWIIRMPQSLDNIFGVYEKALMTRSKRAEVIANNLANVDTPGYQARDLDFKKILRNEVQGQPLVKDMSVTSRSHVNQLLEPSSIDGIKYRTRMQTSLDGNSVDAYIEKAEYADNALRLQASFTFLNGRVKAIKDALRGD